MEEREQEDQRNSRGRSPIGQTEDERVCHLPSFTVNFAFMHKGRLLTSTPPHFSPTHNWTQQIVGPSSLRAVARTVELLHWKILVALTLSRVDCIDHCPTYRTILQLRHQFFNRMIWPASLSLQCDQPRADRHVGAFNNKVIIFF